MILFEIAEKTRERYEQIKKKNSLEKIKNEAQSMPKGSFEFKKALEGSEISFICEVKKASPSKGVIAENFPFLDIAKEYEKAGADAISVLTEPYWFLGKDEYLSKIVKEVSIPVLRKDFTIDEYQIYESKILGASAVLLICALLDTKTISKYLKIIHSLGMNALVEAHNENEIKSAISAGAKIIGVNNRNLKDFSVDITNSAKLRKFVGQDIVFVSESGIKTKDDVQKLRENNTNAVLIGETLMKTKDKREMLKNLRGE